MNGLPMTVDGEPVPNMFLVEPKPEVVCLLTVFMRYAAEHCRPAGVDLYRLTIVANKFLKFFGMDRDPQTLRRPQIMAYKEFRLTEGVALGTIRRELQFLKAAINHARRWDRIKEVQFIELPPVPPPRKRFLSEEEVARVMRQPMSYRMRLFFVIAFATAARARAIEQLTWDRVDFTNGLIDFRLPNFDHKKKRRAIVPMSDELRRRLEAAWARPTRDPADPYVIGCGPSGRCTETYHQAKAVMRAAGIDEVGVARHVARKTFASQALQAGIDIAHVAGVLADTPTTVQKHYGFLLPQHLIGAVNYKSRAVH